MLFLIFEGGFFAVPLDGALHHFALKPLVHFIVTPFILILIF
jgi:hypothetical protein